MKKLNITKETFEKSKYFTGKYGKLAFVSESGNLYKTNKGNILKFVKESRFKDGIANDDEYVFLQVSVAWDLDELEGEVDPDEYIKEMDLPSTVFIKVPADIYEGDGELNLSGMIEDCYSMSVDDIYPRQVTPDASDEWLLWTDDEGLVEDDGVGMRYNEGMKREVMPMNGRKSFGHKAVEEEDENGFTLYSYETPVARLERRDDGSGLDFTILNDYLSSTTLTHIHSWLIGHNQQDIPTKKLLELPVGQEVPMMAAESCGKRKPVNETNDSGSNYFDRGEAVRYNGNQIYTVIDWRRDFAKGIIVYDIQPEGEKDAEILKNVPEDDLGEMYDESTGGCSKRKLAKEAGRKVIPAENGCSIHDMGDCFIVTNKNGLNIGQCRTMIEAEDIAENADEYTAKKLGHAESRKKNPISESIDLYKDTKVSTNGTEACVSVICPKCHKNGMFVDRMRLAEWKNGCRKWENGYSIREAFPNLTRDQQNMLENGKICFDCEYGEEIKESTNVRRELEPTNGRASFGHKAYVEDDGDSFTLFSYNTPVAKIYRSDDGNGQDFYLIDDYISNTTLAHIHSFLQTYGLKDIPTKKILELDVGKAIHLTAAESRKRLAKEEAKGENELSEDAILDAIPVDARDGLIDINEPDGSFGRYTWYVKFAPFSEDEAKIAADGITKSTGKRTTVASFGREVFVLVMDYPSRPASESRKLVKEGAGAGYTVKIKDLKLGKILSKQLVPDKYYGYYECQVEILPGEYEIAAADYYDDFFWHEHELGETPTAKIDGGVATVVYSKQWEDDKQAEEDLASNVEDVELNISFDYGWGWTHVDLPREKIEADHVNVENDGYYASIDKIELNAPDLADAVNSGNKSLDDMEDEQPEEDDGGEEYDESTKKVVKEASEDFERFFETLKFKFRKDGCNVNLRDNEDGSEVIEIDAPTDVDGKLFDFIKRKCESNNWFFERECGRLLTTYFIREDEEPINESFGDEDGWRVFDYGEDFPYTERYTVLDHDGWLFFISHNGGVGSFAEESIDEIDSDEISDILEIEIDGKTYRPRELDSDEISSNRIVKKGLNRIKVNYEYKDEDDLMTESYDNEWAEVGAAFDEFRQRLWRYTRKDRETRMQFYQDCMKKCEEGYKLYHDACVAED